MMTGMLSVALGLLLAQAPAPAKVLVLPASRGGSYAETKGLLLASRITALLSAQGIPIAMDSYQAQAKVAQGGGPSAAACEDRRKCIVAIARQLGVPVVVGVEAGEVQTDLAIHLEALAALDGRSLAKHGFVVRADVTDAELTRPVAAFAAKLAPLLTQPELQARPVAPDAPVAERPVELTPAAPRHVEITKVEKNGTGVLVTSSAAVATGVVAGVFLALGVTEQNQISNSIYQGQSNITLAHATDLKNQANTFYTASLLTAIVAGGLVVASGILWQMDVKNTE